MGQKVHPTGVRVGIIKDWNSKWYADSKNFSDYLVEDQKIRKFLKKKLYLAGISKIEIERTAKAIKVNLYTAKPGIVIGKGGAGAESIKAELAKLIGKEVNLNIVEVKNVDTDAQLVAENIAGQLERRISFRRAMKQCMQKSLKSGALGIKTSVSGRLGGADMARTEFYKEGNIPLQTLRADIDYGFAEADTTYGKIGVKVWIYKGEVLPTKKNEGTGHRRRPGPGPGRRGDLCGPDRPSAGDGENLFRGAAQSGDSGCLRRAAGREYRSCDHPQLRHPLL